VRLPRDLLDEIELELLALHSDRRRDVDRLLALEELYALAVVRARQVSTPVTAADLILGAGDERERERRRALVGALRRPIKDGPGPR
jgi:hypothetical protein